VRGCRASPVRTPIKKITAPVATLQRNRLIATLPGHEASTLIGKCEAVHLRLGEVLSEPGTKIQHVYFPTGGFVSLIASVDQRPRLEVGLVGSEGMLGISVLLGAHVAPLRAIVQGSGSALRLEAAQFSSAIEQSPILRQVLNRYLYVLMNQMAQMAACTHFHMLDARFARWLLMTRDCAQSREFYLTHEFMACMLGVRRVGITQVAGALQKRKLIRYNRGKLTILDTAGLEAAACTCYGVAKDMYARHVTSNHADGDGMRRSRRSARLA
jgi:CRP-like cAMP-binding protein